MLIVSQTLDSQEFRKRIQEARESYPHHWEASRKLMASEGIVNLTQVWQTGVMKTKTPSYQRHRFPSEIISHALWLYHRFCLSFH